ncbi:MAG: lipid-A-disaccharide synthase [Alphaproteobacteria bacterium]|nr:lipid-A-disaccharide synthase [Alphaproteobacteria bacterium]MCK5659039.1 lipid-A-disaccharide synthase [Alphaproteobacteria bacterium]
MNRPLRIFLIAGEASGDFLGAGLMRSLKEEHPDTEFFGVGGNLMTEAGLTSSFPMKEISIMGIAEVLPKLIHILARIRQMSSEILKTKPDVVVTIDSPDFCFRVVKKVKSKTKSIPCVHYVAPSVWAWRPRRAKKVSQFLDHILTLLPFEPPYFEKHGLESTFVGHPVVERLSRRGNGEIFLQKHGIRGTQPILCLLPGSRMSEISRLLKKFCETATIVLQRRPDTVIVVPTLPHLKKHLEKFFVGKGINPILIDRNEDKFDCFSASTAALAASGSVSLELAITDTPHIIAYRMSPISAWIARKMVKTSYANLVNIILDRPVVPELLQERCEVEIISKEILELLESKDARASQLMYFREALIKVGLGDPESPSQKAAKAVLSVINKTGVGT